MRDEDPTLEQLFDAARGLERAPNSQRDRLHSTVAARLAAAGAISATTAIVGKATAGALKGSGVSAALATVKGNIVWVLAFAALGAAGTVFVSARPTLNASRARHANVSASVASLPPVQVLPRSQPSADSRVVTPPSEVGFGELASAHTAPQPRTEHSGLADELALVRSAQSALAAGQPTRVLKLLESYFHRFPAGVLLPEAKATQIKALCLAGQREQADRQAERFAAEHPDSPLAAHNKLRCTP